MKLGIVAFLEATQQNTISPFVIFFFGKTAHLFISSEC